VFCSELPVLYREYFNGAYRISAYFITKQVADLPVFLVTPVIFISIIYWMVGMNDDVERYLLSCLIILVLVQVVISFGKIREKILY